MTTDAIDISKEELVAIWDSSDNNYDLIQIAYRQGYLKGQSDQLRKTDHGLNAVLNILEAKDGL